MMKSTCEHEQIIHKSLFGGYSYLCVKLVKGVDDNDICSVSRQKNPNRLRPHREGPDDEKCFDMSTYLHDHGQKRSTVVPVTQSAATPSRLLQ